MKKLYSLMLIVLMAVFAANASSVTFTNPKGWTKVNAYWWGGDSETCKWPGKEMTGSGSEWTITITGTPEKIIFNNGSEQTGDLLFTDGATYDFDGVVGVENPTFTVNFDNSTAKWAKVYCYTYEGVCTGAWPGTEMTKGEDNIYTISFKAATAPAKVIFNNNTGAQTDNLDFEDGATYNQNGIVGDDPDPDPDPDPSTNVTIYWNNANAKWATPTIHYWGGASSAWPGVKMTKVEGTKNVWQYVCPAGTTNILFNAGDGDATKTPDFKAVNNHIYDKSGDQGEYTGEEPDPTPETLQFFGNINAAGWELADLAEDGSYTFEVTKQSYFTFTTSGNWDKAWRPKTGADLVLTENGTVEAATSGSGTFIIKLAGTYTVTPDADTNSFAIEGFSGDIPDPTPDKLQILIYMEGEEGATWEVKDLDENGSYTFDSTNDIDALFTFTTDGGWDKAWHPLSNIDELITANGTYEAIVSNGADHNNGIFKITAPGTFVVTPDEATTSFTVTGFTEDVEFPEALYIIGYIDGHDFSVLNGMKDTTAESGVYTWEKAVIGDAGAGKGYINIATVVDTEETGNWDATVNSGNRYGAPAADTPLTPDAPAAVTLYKKGVNASACQSWEIEPGIYNVTLNLNDMTIAVEKVTSGIEDVDYVGGAAPVYYNLQGVRVMNPENGMFIEVRGNKAVKVIK